MDHGADRRHGSAPVSPNAPSNKSLGLAVRDLRGRREWSQEELAHASGLHPTYISGIERGLRNPTWLSLGRIAGALEVRMSELAALAEKLDA
jgi:transcriptional regulator with XRE-family HTH domain